MVYEPITKNIHNLLLQRKRDLGGLFDTLAEIHPDIADGFVAKMRNYIDPDPDLTNPNLHAVEREKAALEGARKKLKHLGMLEDFAKKGDTKTKEETVEKSSALVATSKEIDTTTPSEAVNVRKKQLEEFGLPENATKEEFKKAYKKAMIENHPDMAQNRGKSAEEIEAATKRTAELNGLAEAIMAGFAAGQVASVISEQTQQSNIQASQNIFVQAFDYAKGQIQGRIQQIIEKNLKNKLTKEAAKKAAEATAKTAIKTTAKTAAKVGVKTAAKVGVEAAAASTGVGVVLAVALEVLDRAFSLIRKSFGKLNSLIASITGTHDARQNFAYVMMATGGVLMFVGFYPFISVGLVGLGLIGVVTPTLMTGILGGILMIPGLIFSTAVAMAAAFFNAVALAIVLILVGTSIIYFVIQMGAFVVPQGGFGTDTEMGVRGQFHPGRLDPGIPPDEDFPRSGGLPGETLYLRVTKEPSDQQLENNSGIQPITYTVNITARLSDVQLNSMVCTNSLVNSAGETQLGDNSIDVNGVHIPAGGTHRVTYTASVDTSSTDSSLVDRCCILASAQETNRGACGSAIVNIGDGPVSCPVGLPIRGDDQYSPSVSPHNYSASDINLGPGGVDGDYNSYDCGLPVYSTHAGIFTFDDTGPNDGYGIYADVQSVCEGTDFKSRYAHLRAVNADLVSGQYVPAGTLLGLLDDTGRSSACHLHYEFRRQNPDGSWSTYICNRNLPCPY